MEHVTFGRIGAVRRNKLGMSQLKLKIGCTPKELMKAQKLRFEIFNQEMAGEKRGLRGEEIDEDEFAPICEHIIIVDTLKGMVVGTYRLLPGAVAEKNYGFYSETKFNLDSIKHLEGGLLEVGRSCIHKDYRRSQVLNLLWQGIAQYSKANAIRYIFGCANIMTNDPRQVSEYYGMLKALGLTRNDLGITPKEKDQVIKIDENTPVDNPKKIFQKLPALFKGYMSLGLKVCSPPVAGDFGTAVFFVLLDLENMNRSYKRRFLGDYLS